MNEVGRRETIADQTKTVFAPKENTTDVYVQIARPKQSGKKQPPNMPVGIAFAWIDEMGNFATHQATAYARSDAIAIAIGISELVERFPRHKFRAHTTVLDFAVQLEFAELAKGNGGMTTAGKPFAALEYYKDVLKARKDCFLEPLCEPLKGLNSEAFTEAHRIAHYQSLPLSLKHAQEDPIAHKSHTPLNMLLSWDGELLFSFDECDELIRGPSALTSGAR